MRGGVPREGPHHAGRRSPRRAAERPDHTLLANGALDWGDKWKLGKLLGGLARIDAAALDGVTVDAWLDGAGLDRGGARRRLRPPSASAATPTRRIA